MFTAIAPEDLDAKLDSSEHRALFPMARVDSTVRAILHRRRPLLLVESDSPRMTDVVIALRPHVQIFIDRLIRASNLHIDDALQQVLDLGLYNAQLNSLFETLWLARFEFRERRETDDRIRELLDATFVESTPLIRDDALLFWLTLLRQNEESGHVYLLLTGPSVDEDLVEFIHAAEHWMELGSPVRIIADQAAVN